jgi:hypothetical protein
MAAIKASRANFFPLYAPSDLDRHYTAHWASPNSIVVLEFDAERR